MICFVAYLSALIISFNSAAAEEDSAEAISYLRKFFDQHFSDANDS